jgi:hypothetical protein
MRKIKDADPKGYGPQTVVFVSYEFYREVMEYMEHKAYLLDIDMPDATLLLLADVVAHPVPWLKGGDFEIRPKGNTAPKMQYVIPQPSEN